MKAEEMQTTIHEIVRSAQPITLASALVRIDVWIDDDGKVERNVTPVLGAYIRVSDSFSKRLYAYAGELPSTNTREIFEAGWRFDGRQTQMVFLHFDIVDQQIAHHIGEEAEIEGNCIGMIAPALPVLSNKSPADHLQPFYELAEKKLREAMARSAAKVQPKLP